MAKFKATSFDVSLTESEVLVIAEALFVLFCNVEESELFNPDRRDSLSTVEITDLLGQFKKVLN